MLKLGYHAEKTTGTQPSGTEDFGLMYIRIIEDQSLTVCAVNRTADIIHHGIACDIQEICGIRLAQNKAMYLHLYQE